MELCGATTLCLTCSEHSGPEWQDEERWTNPNMPFKLQRGEPGSMSRPWHHAGREIPAAILGPVCSAWGKSTLSTWLVHVTISKVCQQSPSPCIMHHALKMASILVTQFSFPGTVLVSSHTVQNQWISRKQKPPT